MIINVPPQLEAAINEQARQRGFTPDALVLDVLWGHFFPNIPRIEPRDDWERGLFEAARDCGVSLPDSALSSEGLYD